MSSIVDPGSLRVAGSAWLIVGGLAAGCLAGACSSATKPAAPVPQAVAQNFDAIALAETALKHEGCWSSGMRLSLDDDCR